jgi:hypothetical protein
MRNIDRSIEFIFAFLAIDSIGVVSAIHTSPTTLIFPFRGNTQLLLLHFRIILTSIRVVETLASLTNIRFMVGSGAPRQLVVEWETFRTTWPMSIVMAFTKAGCS